MVIGVSIDDIKSVWADIVSMFQGAKFDSFRNLLTIDKKSKSLNKFSEAALSDALAGMELNADEKALVNMVSNSINSEKQYLIEFIKSSDNVSKIGEGLLSKKLPSAVIDPIVSANGGIPGSILSALGGSGLTTATEKGSYSLIINGLDASKSGTDYFDSKTGKYTNNPVGRVSTTGHELFGHGRSLSLGRDSQQQNDAIQTENLILRVMGKGTIQRDGTGHGNGSKVSNPSGIPGYK